MRWFRLRRLSEAVITVSLIMILSRAAMGLVPPPPTLTFYDPNHPDPRGYDGLLPSEMDHWVLSGYPEFLRGASLQGHCNR